MELSREVEAGALGACALTMAHEVLRRAWREAPRMDVVGSRALGRLSPRLAALPATRLYWVTMAGDLVSNAAYYAVAVRGRRPWVRALLAGGLAGVGALTLPQPLGLGRAPHVRRWANRLATVALYTLGALVTAGWVSRQRG